MIYTRGSEGSKQEHASSLRPFAVGHVNIGKALKSSFSLKETGKGSLHLIFAKRNEKTPKSFEKRNVYVTTRNGSFENNPPNIVSF